MPLSQDTSLKLSMTLTLLSGAKTLQDPLVSQLLGELVASSPLAKARRYEANEFAQLPLIRNKQIEAVKQYACVLIPVSESIGLLMDFKVPKGGFRHVSEFMTTWFPSRTSSNRGVTPTNKRELVLELIFSRLILN